ncbi:hypothetical protein QO004_003666 [Rhizobium mesoamericanum]|nr:hypothetical protein [Rhizobium mesoamericanum]
MLTQDFQQRRRGRPTLASHGSTLGAALHGRFEFRSAEFFGSSPYRAGVSHDAPCTSPTRGELFRGTDGPPVPSRDDRSAGELRDRREARRAALWGVSDWRYMMRAVINGSFIQAAVHYAEAPADRNYTHVHSGYPMVFQPGGRGRGAFKLASSSDVVRAKDVANDNLTG